MCLYLYFIFLQLLLYGGITDSCKHRSARGEAAVGRTELVLAETSWSGSGARVSLNTTISLFYCTMFFAKNVRLPSWQPGNSVPIFGCKRTIGTFLVKCDHQNKTVLILLSRFSGEYMCFCLQYLLPRSTYLKLASGGSERGF